MGLEGTWEIEGGGDGLEGGKGWEKGWVRGREGVGEGMG